jgi:hypothetical protein
MEAAVARGKKRRGSGEPEKWASGRTLDSITELPLSAEDVTEAAQLIAAQNEQSGANLAEELQSIARHYWERRFLAYPPWQAGHKSDVDNFEDS